MEEKLLEQITSDLEPLLIDSYFQAVNSVNKKGCKLSRDDKLKALLIPIIALNKLSPFNNTIPFTPDSILLSHDLDLDNLNYNRSNYVIDCPPTGILDPSMPCIYLSGGLDDEGNYSWQAIKKSKKKLKTRLKAQIPWGSETSLMDLHEKWLPSLTQETIKSRDLLDQILVAYTIKKALNGDEESIKKLYALYENTAQAVAVKAFFKPPIKTYLSSNDIKQEAKILLRFIIGGFKPEDILKQLITDNDNKVIATLPLWVRNFYIEYFSKYVPRKLVEILKKADSTPENKKLVLDLMLNAFFNPYTPIVDGTRWKGTPKRINQFNSYSYHPHKMGPRKNLTTWLFGTRKSPQYGKLYQLLKDKYKPWKKRQEINFDFSDNFDEDHEEGLSFEERTKVLIDKSNESPEEYASKTIRTPKECISKLISIGISPRDAEIFTRWKISEETQEKIAFQKGLSRRQVIRICRKVKQLSRKNFSR